MPLKDEHTGLKGKVNKEEIKSKRIYLWPNQQKLQFKLVLEQDVHFSPRLGSHSVYTVCSWANERFEIQTRSGAYPSVKPLHLM